MPHGCVSAIMPATSERVFALLHDYKRRLEWDTLLQAAYLHEGWERAERGAVSTCVGRATLGSLALTTEYVSFDAPRLAAVKMVRGPWLFASWAASIRHEDLPGDRSRVTYTWQFQVRPRGFGWLVGAAINWVFARETKQRLQALGDFLQPQANAVVGQPRARRKSGSRFSPSPQPSARNTRARE